MADPAAEAIDRWIAEQKQALAKRGRGLGLHPAEVLKVSTPNAGSGFDVDAGRFVKIASGGGLVTEKFPTMVMDQAEQPRETFILERGNYASPTERVSPGTPAALPTLPADAPGNRLGLAQWMTAPNHPLTARVAVNRFWQTLFGTGIVKTTADFGAQGAWPSHPELLDWLAVDFVESGWDVMALVRKVVTSATYRQTSAAALVETTLAALGPVVADMVRVQRLTSARPGEICSLAPADLDCSGEVWIYRPVEHKTEHFAKDRLIAIGPRAQIVLAPYLLNREPEVFCFSPTETARPFKAQVYYRGDPCENERALCEALPALSLSYRLQIARKR